jgi:tryptophan-rich sensory protein
LLLAIYLVFKNFNVIRFFVASSLTVMVVSAATESWWPAVLIVPYVAWLIFASQLNFARVNQ